MNYRLAYALAFHPSEDLAEHPPFADELLELMGGTDIEVADTQPDPHRAALQVRRELLSLAPRRT